MKKIIFLDGDGTLWYPKETKRSVKPHWIYENENTKDNYLKYLELTPRLFETLEKLNTKGIFLVVVSANPNPEEQAVKEISERLEYFEIMKFFQSVRASKGDDPNGKAKVILEEIEKYGFKKEDALMIGDSYFYDYLAATNVGVDALWIENPVSKLPDNFPANFKKIKEVYDVCEEIN